MGLAWVAQHLPTNTRMSTPTISHLVPGEKSKAMSAPNSSESVRTIREFETTVSWRNRIILTQRLTQTFFGPLIERIYSVCFERSR